MQAKYSEMCDADLVSLSQEGDSDAEEALIRKYKGMIRAKSHLYFVMGADAEDVMQEGMIGMFRAIHSYDHEKQATFKTYAEICINRQILSAVKHAARMKYAPLNTSISLNTSVSTDNRSFGEKLDGTLEDSLTAGIGDDPEAVLIMKEKMEGIENSGKGFFSEMESKVLVEFLQGKTCRQIAINMGKSAKSVDNAIQRARKKLENHLSNL